MDQYRRIIEGYLEEDSRNWRKQRHTGRKIYERLRDEHGCKASESTVRHYVAKVKRERGEQKFQFLTLVWHPGEAQVDFGEADFYVMGVRRRLYFMAVSFPYSNVGLTQLFPGQNAECVCQGLKNVFEYLGGVPCASCSTTPPASAARSPRRSEPPTCSAPSRPTTVSPSRSATRIRVMRRATSRERCASSGKACSSRPSRHQRRVIQPPSTGQVHGAVERQGALAEGRARGPALRRGPIRPLGIAREAVRGRQVRRAQDRQAGQVPPQRRAPIPPPRRSQARESSSG